MRGSLDSGRVPSLRWRLLILVSIASLVDPYAGFM